MVAHWVTAFLDLAAEDFERDVIFWARVTGYQVSTCRGDTGEFATLVPPRGDDFLRVQRLDAGPPRVHLDLHVDDPVAAADRATGLGARVEVRSPHGYVVLTSPGGLPFCFVGAHGGTRPVAATWPGGHRSLVDQVCLDLPGDVHAAEVTFWQELLGWELVVAPVAAEFSHLRRPEGQPFRILLQRLGEETGPVRAHLDLATTDRSAETARHLRLGAGVLRVHPHFTVLTDPAGSAYCITDRDPETGSLAVPAAH